MAFQMLDASIVKPEWNADVNQIKGGWVRID
jgi:hypothetical protein